MVVAARKRRRRHKLHGTDGADARYLARARAALRAYECARAQHAVARAQTRALLHEFGEANTHHALGLGVGVLGAARRRLAVRKAQLSQCLVALLWQSTGKRGWEHGSERARVVT